MNQSDPAKELSMSGSVAKLIEGAFESYFQLRTVELSPLKRFLCAWLGAQTLFVSGFFLCIGPAGWIAKGCIGSGAPGGVTPTTTGLIAAIVAPILFGGIIASAGTKHGPVRLYLFGLVLATFVVSVVFRVWTAV